MLTSKFCCSPDIGELLRLLGKGRGRFAIENIPAGKAQVGAAPRVTLKAKNGIITRRDQYGKSQRCADPFEALREELTTWGSVEIPADTTFAGGAVGYFSYDLGRSVEHIPTIALEDVSTPDYCLGFYDSALIVDSPAGTCTAFSLSDNQDEIARWQELAMQAEVTRETVVRAGPIMGNFCREDYIAAITRVKDYIAAGDVYQVNLSQRFTAELDCDAVELYSALRRVNPAPEACYMEIDGPTLVCASPELFVDYDPVTRRVVTKPIKGTRPRGSTPEEDNRLREELSLSTKDRAENIMIVDMERNDLGRVASYGTVQAPDIWTIEEHPNVFQMVSTVEARLAEGRDAVDLLRAMFPGGSITGAPKVRAMEIIEELEPHRRGIYTGAAGILDFRGGMHLNIVIRSFVVKDGTAYFHAGGGIVADSKPEMEYQETLDKISGLIRALGDAR